MVKKAAKGSASLKRLGNTELGHNYQRRSDYYLVPNQLTNVLVELRFSS
jgi:hypothetical protein